MQSKPGGDSQGQPKPGLEISNTCNLGMPPTFHCYHPFKLQANIYAPHINQVKETELGEEGGTCTRDRMGGPV